MDLFIFSYVSGILYETKMLLNCMFSANMSNAPQRGCSTGLTVLSLSGFCLFSFCGWCGFCWILLNSVFGFDYLLPTFLSTCLPPSTFEPVHRFYEIQRGSHAIEDGLKTILFNPVTSTIPKWQTFKHLR
jgi:hypothetical protein